MTTRPPAGFALGTGNRVRSAHWALLGLALACAVAAVVIGNEDPESYAAAHIAAAGFGLFAAAAIVWASMERASREPTRHAWFVMSGVGTGIVLVGQSIGYLLTRNTPGYFDPRIETIPLLIGMPLAGFGAVMLSWPRGMSRSERMLVTIDSLLGIGALWVLWAQVVIPRWAAPLDDTMLVWARIDQIALFAGLCLIIVLTTASRRLGSLPLPQLLLLLGGVALWLLSDLAGELGPDRSVAVTASIIGYTLSVALIVAMAHRSAAETESPRQTRWRAALSTSIAMVLLIFAGLVVIGLAADQLTTSAKVVTTAVWVLSLLGIAFARATSMTDWREVQIHGSTQQLSESAAKGWVGTLLRDSAEYVLVLDAQGRIVFASPRTQSVLAPGERLSDMVVDPEPDEIGVILAGVASQSVPHGPHEMLFSPQSGAHREVEVYVRPVNDMEFEGFVVTGTDVTDARRLAQSLDLTRRRDELTGLLTPEAMAAEVAASLAGSTSARRSVVFAVLDITDFGVWNDSLGRQGGDEILQGVARQMEGLPEDVQAVSRMAGDSFGLLITSPQPVAATEQVIDTIRRSLAGLILGNDVEVDLSFRVGFSLAGPGEQMQPEQIMEQADVALRRARKSRHAQVVQFRPGMNEDLVNRLGAELRIREALHNDGIAVFYQPILSLRDASIRSFEALARIRPTHGGVVEPDAFMEAAEYSGLILDIDRRVRQIVAADWAAIARATGTDVRVNINVTQLELNAELVADLERLGLTGKVTIEVTEASLLSNPVVARQTLETIRQAGGKVAIDDFGTGYSSLSQIVSLPCDILKIDRSFVCDMSETSTTSSLVRAMVQLADDIGLHTVAEGVETAEQAVALRAIGCDGAQGFHYARPLPMADLLRWIAQHTSAGIPSPATPLDRPAATGHPATRH